MSSIIRATTTSGLQVAPDNSGSLQLQTNGTTAAVTIDTSQNVGIGTTTPTTLLHLKSTGSAILTIEADSDNITETDNARIELSQDGGAVIGRIGYSSGTNSIEIWNEYAENLVFGTNNLERMRINSSGLLQFNSGYGSVATAYGCRAWVNFNGTGTVAIRASGNVTSITDNGTGDYTVNFTTAMPDANYSISGMTACQTGTGSPGYVVINHPTTAPTSSAVRIRTQNDANTATDYVYVCVDIHR